MSFKGVYHMDLLTRSTSTALWHEIIHEAEASAAITLHEDLEAYLVFLLMRYTDKPDLLRQIIAMEFMQGLQSSTAQKNNLLQAVGDKCLLFAGLFPHIAEKRLVRISYFVNIGQSAYVEISRENGDLYYALADQFVPLMDVLQSIRQQPDLLPLQAYELWNETGSKRAFSILKQYTPALPQKTHQK